MHVLVKLQLRRLSKPMQCIDDLLTVIFLSNRQAPPWAGQCGQRLGSQNWMEDDLVAWLLTVRVRSRVGVGPELADVHCFLAEGQAVWDPHSGVEGFARRPRRRFPDRPGAEQRRTPTISGPAPPPDLKEGVTPMNPEKQ